MDSLVVPFGSDCTLAGPNRRPACGFPRHGREKIVSTSIEKCADTLHAVLSFAAFCDQCTFIPLTPSDLCVSLWS